MTHPHEEMSPALITGHVTAHIIDTEKSVPVADRAATFGAYLSTTLAKTDPAIMLLPRDPYRLRAFISIVTPQGTTTDSCWVGTQAQTQATTNQGFRLSPNNQRRQCLEIRNQQDLWAVADTGNSNPIELSVLIERWGEEQ